MEKYRAYQKAWKEKNKEKIKEYMEEYSKKYYEENKERLTPIRKKWADENPEKNREYALKYYHTYKPKSISNDKTRARSKTQKLVAKGIIEKKDNCEECNHDGSRFKIVKHHEDYSKPEQVIFLCTKCHGKRHSKR